MKFKTFVTQSMVGLGLSAGLLAGVSAETLKSRGKNSPWLGYMMNGQVKTTLVDGRVVYQA